MISFGAQALGMSFAINVGGETVNNGDATIDNELDRSAIGFPQWVGLGLFITSAADTATLDQFTLHGATTTGFTPADANIIATHPAFTAAASGSWDGQIAFLATTRLANAQYVNATVSNNVAANLVIAEAIWFWGWGKTVPQDAGIGDFLTPGPAFAIE